MGIRDIAKDRIPMFAYTEALSKVFCEHSHDKYY